MHTNQLHVHNVVMCVCVIMYSHFSNVAVVL